MPLLQRPALLSQFKVVPDQPGITIASNDPRVGDLPYALTPGNAYSAYALADTAYEVRDAAEGDKARAGSPVRVHNRALTSLGDTAQPGKSVAVLYGTIDENTVFAQTNITYTHAGRIGSSAVSKGTLAHYNSVDAGLTSIGDYYLQMRLSGDGLAAVSREFLDFDLSQVSLKELATAFSAYVFFSGDFQGVLQDGLFVLDANNEAHPFLGAGTDFQETLDILNGLNLSPQDIRIVSKPPQPDQPVSPNNKPLVEMHFYERSNQLSVELMVKPGDSNEGLFLEGNLLQIWQRIVSLSGSAD